MSVKSTDDVYEPDINLDYLNVYFCKTSVMINVKKNYIYKLSMAGLYYVGRDTHGHIIIDYINYKNERGTIALKVKPEDQNLVESVFLKHMIMYDNSRTQLKKEDPLTKISETLKKFVENVGVSIGSNEYNEAKKDFENNTK